MTINDKSNGRFAEIIKFAASSEDKQIRDTFLRCMLSFAMFTEGSQGVDIYSDFADKSLAFTVMGKTGPMFNGGMIYHAPPGEPAKETFTVSLDSSFYGFSIHT